MSVEGQPRDQGQLLGIFPAEVWLNVLGDVKKAADFQRICNASPYFRTLLQPRATQALFPEALQILTQKQPPLLVSTAELLPLRQVCHAWKSGVEQALEDPEYHFLFEREQWEKRYSMKDNPTYVNREDARIRNFEAFEKVEDFTKFQQQFNPTRAAAHSRNPLFCREVIFFIPEELQDFQPYFQACLQFLQNCGTHIWYCSVVQNFGELEQHRQLYSLGLKQLLALMPNLRLVHFTDDLLNDGFDEPGIPELLQAVEDSMAVTPVAELKQLQMISMQGFPLSFLRALVRKNPQVSIVSDAGPTSKQDYIPLYLEQMPHLTSLELRLFRPDEFELFRSASVQLSKLHLNIMWGKVYHFERRRPVIPTVMGPLFRVLEAQFPATLSDLSLKFHGRLDSTEKDLKLQLPHLKKLSVTFPDQLVPLDFVLPLKDTLEQLVVGVRYSPRRGDHRQLPPFDMKEVVRLDRTEVKLYQFWMEPQKSNAWVLFPKLKLLRTTESEKMYSCAREEWIAQQPKQ